MRAAAITSSPNTSSDPVNFADRFGLDPTNDPNRKQFTGTDAVAVFRMLARMPIDEAILASGELAITTAAFGVVSDAFLGGIASTIARNAAAGRAGEIAAARLLQAAGATILGSRVGARTSAGLRVSDHVVQMADGSLVAAEVKTGMATRRAAQLLKDSRMATEGAKLVGKNAPEALRGRVLQLPTIVIRPF